MCTPFVAELPNFTWKHKGKWLILDGQPRGWPSKTSHFPLCFHVKFGSSPILVVHFYLRIYRLTRNYQISHGNTYRKGAYFSVVSLTLATRERGHSAPRFWGSFYLSIHPLSHAELPNLMWYTRRGGVYLGGQPRLSSQLRQQSSSAPQILGFLLYLCVHPLTQNYQIRHGNQ